MANNTGKKYGGREAVTPNRITNKVREALNLIIQKELDFLINNIDQLELKDRLEFLIKILPYIIPKEKAKDEIKEPEKQFNTIIVADNETAELIKSLRGELNC